MARLLSFICAAVAIIATTASAQALRPCAIKSPLVPYTGIDVEIYSKSTPLSLPSIQSCDGSKLFVHFIGPYGQLLYAQAGKPFPFEGSFATAISSVPTVAVPMTVVPIFVRGPDLYVNFGATPTRPPTPTQAQWDMLASRLNMKYASDLMLAPQPADCLSVVPTQHGISSPLAQSVSLTSVYDALTIGVKGACDRVLWACVSAGQLRCHPLPLNAPLFDSQRISDLSRNSFGRDAMFRSAFTGPSETKMIFGYTTPSNPIIRSLGASLFLSVIIPPARLQLFSLDAAPVSRTLFVSGSAPDSSDASDGSAGWESASSWTGAAIGACLVAVFAIGVVAYRRRHNVSTLQASLGATSHQGYSTL